jgi:hypothetical protein
MLGSVTTENGAGVLAGFSILPNILINVEGTDIAEPSGGTSIIENCGDIAELRSLF